MSQQIVQRCRCRTGAMCYALRIRIIHDHSAAPALGSAICYALRNRIMHHSAAPALGNAIDYAPRIRVIYQAPKARRRGLCTTHYVSVICIKSRKPAGEGHVLRITYPHYVSSTESPPERAMYYALRIRIIYQALKDCPRELCTTHYVSVLCIKRRKPAEEGYGVRITYPYYVSSAEP